MGIKDAAGDGTFLDRNGLARGRLYAWVPLSGATTPEQFNGTGSSMRGNFARIAVRDAAQAGEPGYDDAGYLDDTTMRARAEAAGAFMFSRPEDVAVNPDNGRQLVLASTGRGQLYPSDNWGDTYVIDLRRVPDSRARSGAAVARILYDGDDADKQDFGLRSPDNLDWADDGSIYVQEDRSTSPSELFGASSGEEASIWQLDPVSGQATRIARIDRTGIPVGQTDSDPDTIGVWETSGILDVTALFGAEGTLLLGDVQAHGLTGGPIDAENLVEGGQLFLLSSG